MSSIRQVIVSVCARLWSLEIQIGVTFVALNRALPTTVKMNLFIRLEEKSLYSSMVIVKFVPLCTFLVNQTH